MIKTKIENLEINETKLNFVFENKYFKDIKFTALITLI
tara:strand:+ start:242 stop:355 length:114 start_codon:yes stop_codon:yes gene_type:complete